MWIEGNRLRTREKDKNGKIYKKTIINFGKIKPIFQLPFIHRGCCEDLLSSLKDNCIALILTDPPYGLTVNKWYIAPNWKKIR